MKAAKATALGLFLALVPVGLHALLSQEPDAKPQEKAQPEAAKPAECRWVDGAIELDGVIKERAWKNAEVLELQVPWQTRKPHAPGMARLLWDANYLYFCGEMDDHDLYADVKEPNGSIWENDSLAMFFKPSEQKLGYYQFQVSAASTPLELYFPSRGGGGYNRFAKESPIQFEGFVKLQGTLNDWTDKDKGWTVEGRIPWSAFKATGGRPKAGDRWRFAVCRYDYSVTLDQPELSTTAALTKADFHRYEEYQELIFVERK